jgi:hypothetical protein
MVSPPFSELGADEGGDAEEIRALVPEFHDWVIPTGIQLAMHVQLLKMPGAVPQDVMQFAQFLDIFYEEMSEWSAALRRHQSRR